MSIAVRKHLDARDLVHVEISVQDRLFGVGLGLCDAAAVGPEDGAGAAAWSVHHCAAGGLVRDDGFVG